MNINDNWDKYLDPPDEPEQEYCEYCNQTMEYHCDNVGGSNQEIWWKCLNPYCPDKFSDKVTYMGDTLIEMSLRLAEVEQELSSTWSSLSFVRRKLALTEGRLVEREGTIEDLELKLTPSQSKEVVRDTEYQITRMQDAIDYAYNELSSGEDTAPLHCVQREWNEVKKILNYGK